MDSKKASKPTNNTDMHPLSKKPKFRQQTVALLAPSSEHTLDLWLVCPPDTSGSEIPSRKINVYFKNKNDWLNKSFTQRQLYR